MEGLVDSTLSDQPGVVRRTIALVRVTVVIGLVLLVTLGGEEARSYQTLGMIITCLAAVYAVVMYTSRFRLPPWTSTMLDLGFSLAVIAAMGAGRSLGISLLFLVLAATALQFPRRVAVWTAGWASLGAALLILLVPRPDLSLSTRVELAIGWSTSLLLASVLIGLLSERELRDREALVQARERVAALAEQDDARRRVLRMVAHDLTSPVAAIQGVARSLQDPTVDLAPDARAEALSLIIEQADHLRSFASSLQEIAWTNEPGRGPTERRESVALGPWLESLCKAESFGLTRLVEFEARAPLPTIETDPGRLRRVLVNLIDNAVRHGRPGAPVCISADHEGDHVSIRVIDTGTGVRSDDLETIFRPRWQGDDAVGEMGLGLWIVAEFVHELGGTVKASNHSSGGLDVEVVLPIVAEPGPRRLSD